MRFEGVGPKSPRDAPEFIQICRTYFAYDLNCIRFRKKGATFTVTSNRQASSKRRQFLCSYLYYLQNLILHRYKSSILLKSGKNRLLIIVSSMQGHPPYSPLDYISSDLLICSNFNNCICVDLKSLKNAKTLSNLSKHTNINV